MDSNISEVYESNSFKLDLETPGEVKSRSSIFQRAVNWNPLQIRPNLLSMMDRKSYIYGLSCGGICFDLVSDLVRSNRGQAYFGVL